jgi:hypothetical protein
MRTRGANLRLRMSATTAVMLSTQVRLAEPMELLIPEIGARGGRVPIDSFAPGSLPQSVSKDPRLQTATTGSGSSRKSDRFLTAIPLSVAKSPTVCEIGGLRPHPGSSAHDVTSPFGKRA